MGYYIRQERMFYSRRLFQIFSHDGIPVKFQTKESAMTKAQSLNSRPYLLEPDEYARPACVVMPYEMLDQPLKEYIKKNGRFSAKELERIENE